MNIFYNPRCPASITAQLCALFQRRFNICLEYQTLSFLFLEQGFQLSLSDEIGCTYRFLIIPKYFFISMICRWFEKMTIYWLSIVFFGNIAHPSSWGTYGEPNFFSCCRTFQYWTDHYCFGNKTWWSEVLDRICMFYFLHIFSLERVKI